MDFISERELTPLQTVGLHWGIQEVAGVTYLVTYQTWPVALRRISWLLTVTSWNVARFSLRKNVSGTQTFRTSSWPSRTCAMTDKFHYAIQIANRLASWSATC